MKVNFKALARGVFMKGINIHEKYARTQTNRLIEFLKGTKIEWVRIHPLPTRKLDTDSLNAIDKFCAAGYNLIVPIDVGVVDNVGEVSLDKVEKFVGDSYDFAKAAVTRISRIVREHDRHIVYGIENEIDTKEWFLQSLPRVGWRKSPEAWFKMASDVDLKYRRLNNILKGVKDADPRANTMVNVEADDLWSFIGHMDKHIKESEELLKGLGLIENPLLSYLEDWEVEMGRVAKKLAIDLVGLDNYPNYLNKYPVRGQEIGSRVDRAAQLSGKPAINCEFGYTTYRPFWLNVWYELTHIPSSSELQLKFFENALQSITASSSKGTFPWVMLTDSTEVTIPGEENGFGIMKVDPRIGIRREPAFDCYVRWLEAK